MAHPRSYPEMPSREPVLREMHVEDIPEVLEVQQPAAVAGRSAVFRQVEHPFPRQGIAERWEKLGWRPAGESSRGRMPPHAELLTYELALDRRSRDAISPSTSSVDLTSP